jgi:hypothetical protein
MRRCGEGFSEVMRASRPPRSLGRAVHRSASSTATESPLGSCARVVVGLPVVVLGCLFVIASLVGSETASLPDRITIFLGGAVMIAGGWACLRRGLRRYQRR